MRIHIFGASGSGVTTTGQALAKKLNLPYYDSDDYFWQHSNPPFTFRQHKHVRNINISTDLYKSEHWILGGSVFDWGNNVFPDFDLVVFLLLPPEIRIERLKRREHATYGDIIFTDPERNKQFENFIAWATDYDINSGLAKRNIKAHENWLSNISFPTLRISGDLSTTQRIQLIVKHLSNKNSASPAIA